MRDVTYLPAFRLMAFTTAFSAACQGGNHDGFSSVGGAGGTGGSGGGPSSSSSSSASGTGGSGVSSGPGGTGSSIGMGGTGGSGGSETGSGGGQLSCGAACAPGQKLCSKGPVRTCRSVEDAAVGCGDPSCGPCPSFPNGLTLCAGGACALGACLPGFVDCDMDPANGCEVHVVDDPTHCGACGTACATSERCIGGHCVGACGPPYVICNGLCTDTQTAVHACGGCNLPCAAPPPGQSVECVAGSCVYAELPCPAGLSACDGVCTDLTTNRSHCGACGAVCQDPMNAFAVCNAGRCEPCPPGTTDACLPRECTDLAHENGACGACDTRCPTGAMCRDGRCVDLATLRIVEATVSDFVVDGGLVYFVNATDGTINSVPVGGGAIHQLASFQERPGHIAVDATRVLWTNTIGGTVMAVPKTGGSPAIIASEPGTAPDYVVSDGTNAYFIIADRLLAAPIAGGPTTLLYQSPLDITFGIRAPLSNLTQNSTMLFFTIHDPFIKQGQSVHKNGTPTGLPSLGGYSIAATDTDVFSIGDVLTGPGDLKRCSIADAVCEELWGVGPFGFNAALDALALDGEDVFFFGTAGLEHVLACGSRMPDVIASVLETPVRKIEVDASHVYWSDGASISRVPR